MRMRMGDGFRHLQLAGFDDGDGLGTFHGGESLQKIVYRFTALKRINQILQGDTRTGEDRRSAHDFGIGMNDAFQIFNRYRRITIPLAEAIGEPCDAGIPVDKQDGSLSEVTLNSCYCFDAMIMP